MKKIVSINFCLTLDFTWRVMFCLGYVKTCMTSIYKLKNLNRVFRSLKKTWMKRMKYVQNHCPLGQFGFHLLSIVAVVLFLNRNIIINFGVNSVYKHWIRWLRPFYFTAFTRSQSKRQIWWQICHFSDHFLNLWSHFETLRTVLCISFKTTEQTLNSWGRYSGIQIFSSTVFPL